MKAIVQHAYGAPADVLRLEDAALPLVGDYDVRVKATSVHADVWHVIAGWPYMVRLMGDGLLKTKRVIPGVDLAGIVERVGRQVTKFSPGDEVFRGGTLVEGWRNCGTFAE